MVCLDPRPDGAGSGGGVSEINLVLASPQVCVCVRVCLEGRLLEIIIMMIRVNISKDITGSGCSSTVYRAPLGCVLAPLGRRTTSEEAWV